jgi:hypothetical protein
MTPRCLGLAPHSAPLLSSSVTDQSISFIRSTGSFASCLTASPPPLPPLLPPPGLPPSSMRTGKTSVTDNRVIMILHACHHARPAPGRRGPRSQEATTPMNGPGLAPWCSSLISAALSRFARYIKIKSASEGSSQLSI